MSVWAGWLLFGGGVGNLGGCQGALASYHVSYVGEGCGEVVLPATVEERVEGTVVFGCGWGLAYSQVELLGRVVLGEEGAVVNAQACKGVAVWAAGEMSNSASVPGDGM